MSEELLIPGAQVIESRLTIRRESDSILGATAITGEAHGTIPTVSWEVVSFGKSKLMPTLSPDQYREVGLAYIA